MKNFTDILYEKIANFAINKKNITNQVIINIEDFEKLHYISDINGRYMTPPFIFKNIKIGAWQIIPCCYVPVGVVVPVEFDENDIIK